MAEKLSLGGRLRLLAMVAAGVSALVLLGTWNWGRLFPQAVAPELKVSAGQTDAMMRRIEVAFADAQEVWGRAAHGRYRPARTSFFSGSTATPCAGGGVSGPFYCAETGTAAFDLAFLGRLGQRLQRQEDLGLALVAARLSAEHMQRETGMLDAASLRVIGAGGGQRAGVRTALALQADCLTGLWAAAAGARLGPVPEPFWGELVWSWRNSVDDLRAAGTPVPPEFDPFAGGSKEERQAAFVRGYAGNGLAACPAPPAIVARG